MPLNKRRQPRVPISMGLLPAAKMTLFKPFFHELSDVEIQDISAGGMKIATKEILPLYFEFGLEFQIQETEIIQAKAKAVHQMRIDDTYLIGVSFTEIDVPLQELLNNMGEDYQSCEERIRKDEKDVCRKDCRFIKLCRKPQKKY